MFFKLQISNALFSIPTINKWVCYKNWDSNDIIGPIIYVLKLTVKIAVKLINYPNDIIMIHVQSPQLLITATLPPNKEERKTTHQSVAGGQGHAGLLMTSDVSLVVTAVDVLLGTCSGA